MSDDDNIFSRWSRRKRAVEKEEVPVPAVELAEPEREILDGDEEEQALLERLNLPLPESLKEGDDFSIFMRANVPGFLRKRALHVLWRSNPVLANLDGLNDYDDDFTSPELTKKVLATGYKVGRGFLKDLLEEKPEDIPDEAGETPEPVLAAVEIVDDDNDIAGESGDLEETDNPAGEDMSEAGDGEDESFRPRRMKFDA